MKRRTEVILDISRERGARGYGMVKSSVTLNFCLGRHWRQENVLRVKKKILRYRNLEACCVIQPNGSSSL